MEGAKVLGVYIDWLDRVIREICMEHKHLELVQNAQSLKGQIEEMKKQVCDMEQQLTGGSKNDHQRHDHLLGQEL